MSKIQLLVGADAFLRGCSGKVDKNVNNSMVNSAGMYCYYCVLLPLRLLVITLRCYVLRKVYQSKIELIEKFKGLFSERGTRFYMSNKPIKPQFQLGQ
ncbi:MAG: hypothetical protein HRT71_14455 [Flavobacteriales bacterium]|nr:hypothetical protein [Flavobacteriales bacterium]